MARMEKEMENSKLAKAKINKKDEFYTQWADIEREVQAYVEYNPDVFRGKTILCPCDDPEWSNFTKYFALHFHEYGLKKLISTSYATNSKYSKTDYQLSKAEMNDPRYDKKKTRTHGKLFVLEGRGRRKKIDIDDLHWDYMEGDGDFRSAEVLALRDEADIIVTNPPFSLFREFLPWILEKKKQFLVIGNVNAFTYKEVFPLIMENEIWCGPSITSGDRKFNVPDDFPLYAAGCGVDENGKKFIRVKGVRWFTNIDHGRRHQALPLMTEADNLKFSKHKEIKGKPEYDRYENFDAIEVPFTDAIPVDYAGVMGVPITFLDKYCPEQFDIIGLSRYTDTQGMSKEFVEAYYKSGQTGVISEGHPDLCYYDNVSKKPTVPYMRVLIKRRDV